MNDVELLRLRTKGEEMNSEMSATSGDSETNTTNDEETESTQLYGTRPSPHPTRIWPATYVCVVAASGFLLFGLSKGFNSPVLSDLKSRTGYTSLHRTVDQDLFNVGYSWKPCNILYHDLLCKLIKAIIYLMAWNLLIKIL